MIAQVWSCGGGVQSAAIGALIVQGRLPKPDMAVIIDTNREKTSTWKYLEGTLIPALASVGVEIQRVDSSLFRTVDLWSKADSSLLLPVFTNLSGEKSKLPAFCSNEWKSRVLSRWLRSIGVDSARSWLGISRDEMSRVRAQRSQWLTVWYPLIFEVPMRRQDCIALVADMGWPEAPRSSCWMCPNMRDREWIEMKNSHPEDFTAAVELERTVRERDPAAYLHESLKPLDEVDFSENQQSFTDGSCAGGHCWV
jgi:hypothetical protein